MQTQPRSTLSELFKILRPFWPQLLAATLLGVLGGAAITALLATINYSLHSDGGLQSGLLLGFAALCLLALVGSIVADIGTNYVGQHVIARLRKELGSKIISAPIEQIERYRSHRLIPVLTHDVDTISDFAFAFAPLAVSLSVCLGCLGYLASLSLPMFLTTAVAIVIGSAVQYFARSKGIKGFFEARDEEDELQKHYRAMAEGAKELRISRPRRFQHYSERLQGSVERICDIQVRSINQFVIAKGFGSTLFFIVIGVALAYQALWPSTDKATLSGFILVLLYMKGPLEHLVGNLPIVSRAQVAFRRIAELSQRFSSPEPHLLLKDDGRPALPLDSLELRDLHYRYPTEDGGQGFAVGPLNLQLRRGEILFIAGDNGSGKTTLIKLLLGLYVPQQGQLLLNGQPIDDASRDDYRQLFTTIFADYYLFEDLLKGSAEIPAEANRYLQRLEIADKVILDGHAYSTTDLSTGQRKRLALVQAWLEKRPLLVFDEWAADQDPEFRRIFYTELLPELRAQGKTLIVISHDDRYFDIADRLLRMSGGRVVELRDQRVGEDAPDRSATAH
ncbi:cyclic peptide export ABC transporter [Pseudomonas citronellolis]|uniref:cyclic peptide export ABC transporter n=1 Tax=Pseudomonas citronellolis TaxID=53408 RepID=UPI0023E3539F|nr:cyclic peptide export ABC transporter [Pseudomonas citronellolis]MDF3935148.1 cyclic peptide export ABC transporter [Pseudomonas citronellolis]